MLYENFISIEEQENLRDWAYKEECRLNPNGPGRFFNKIKNLSENELVYTIKERIIKKFNFLNFKPEPVLSDWVGIIKKGGFVHFHTDKFTHLYIGEHHRLNVLIQLPEEGGINIYDGKELAVKERMLVYYRPDLYEHGSTRVIGNRHRLNLSFGFVKDMKVHPIYALAAGSNI
jgi:hypothetical protein